MTEELSKLRSLDRQ